MANIFQPWPALNITEIQELKTNGWPPDAIQYVTMTFTDGTRTFQIAPSGTHFVYYADGVGYTKNSAETVQITDTEGLWFIYYVDDTLTASQTPWSIIDNNRAFVAALYWSSTDSEAIVFANELHSYAMDAATHRYLHFTEGTRFASGLALGNMSVDGTGGSDSDAQFSVSDGVIYDEDIRIDIEDGSPQELSTIAQVPMFYRSGAAGDWRMIDATNFAVTTTGTGRAAWNEYTGSTWQLTEASISDFVLTQLLATGDLNHPIIGIVGQNTYTTKALAQAGATTELTTLRLGALEALSPEFTPIATVIFQTGSFANTVKSKIVSTDDGDDYVDWRVLVR